MKQEKMSKKVGQMSKKTGQQSKLVGQKLLEFFLEHPGIKLTVQVMSIFTVVQEEREQPGSFIHLWNQRKVIDV